MARRRPRRARRSRRWCPSPARAGAHEKDPPRARRRGRRSSPRPRRAPRRARRRAAATRRRRSTRRRSRGTGAGRGSRTTAWHAPRRAGDPRARSRSRGAGAAACRGRSVEALCSWPCADARCLARMAQLAAWRPARVAQLGARMLVSRLPSPRRPTPMPVTQTSLAELLEQLVNIPSVTGNEQQIVDWLTKRLAGGSRGEVIRHGLSIVWRAPRKGRPLVVLAGHTDTVPPQGNATAKRDGDRITGLGTTDMKGGDAV